MKKVKIYVAMHKKATFPKCSIYVPIQVGAKGKEKITKVTDDVLDNISVKNPNFCELTATYWIYKNDKSDIVGLTHYRRYFFKDNSKGIDDVLDKKDILNILNDYDIIVPQKTYFVRYKNMENAYKKLHNEKDLIECRNIMSEKYPQYVSSFDKVMKRRSFYAFNMFISNKKTFDSYYSWLFDILFELEKRIDISDYDDYNKRIYGFLSERLFNVWLCYNKLRVKEVMVYNTEESFSKQSFRYKFLKLLFDKKERS